MTRPVTGYLDNGKPIYGPEPERLAKPRATVDAAQSTDENARHWTGADGLSAASANNPMVRARLRNRARYEVLNNCYAGGLVQRLANDCIGTGPRVQLTIPGADEETVRAVEDSFAAWAADPAVNFADKLRVLDEAAIRDGEGFALFSTNRAVSHPVKLDLRLVEADQVTTPGSVMTAEPGAVDGIRFDAAGNPIEYHVLDSHPGDQFWGMPFSYQRVRADLVIHWFTPRRAGEPRGLPEITAALPVFNQVRRYNLATLSSAEWAACIAGILTTNLPPSDGGEVTETRTEIVEIVRNALVAPPAGHDLKQLKTEQPAAGFGDTKREFLNECGASVNAPLNVVTGNSSGYNFSSGRLDHIPYHRGLWIRRGRLKTRALDRTVRTWADEATAVVPEFRGLPDPATWGIDWQWDGFDSIDPEAEAATDEQELRNNTVTLAEICARKGTDWKAVLKQRAAEKKFAEDLGLIPTEAAPGSPPVRPDPTDPQAPAKARAARRQKPIPAGEAAYA